MIPTVVHHIWVDVPGRREPVAPWVIRQMRHWDTQWLPPGWTHKLWTTDMVLADDDLARFAATAAKLGLPHRGLSDLLRFRILHREGGLYMDIDVLPIGPLEPIVKRPTIFHSLPQATSTLTLDQWALSLPPGHPFAADMLAYAAEQLRLGHKHETWIAGPRATRTVYDSGDYDLDIVWDCPYANTAKTRAAMATGDLTRLDYPYPLLPTLGGRE